MKILNILFCGLFLFSTTVQAQIIDDTPQSEVKKIELRGCGYSRPIIVAGMVGNPPFGWVEYDEARERKPYESYGLGRDILDKMTRKLGMSYISTGFRSFDDALLALKKGEIDLLLGTYYQPKRLGLGTDIISPSYFQNVFTVYFKKGKEFPVSSVLDLVGFKGILRREEHLYPLIQSQLPIGIELTQVSGAKKAFEMLLNEEVDYLISSPYSTEAELRRYKLNGKIITDNTIIKDAGISYALSTNSACYQDLKKVLGRTLQDNEFSPAKISEMVYKSIDNWGERFRNEPGLVVKSDSKNDDEMTPPVPPTE